MKCDELKATTAQQIVREEKDCDYMDELFGGVKMPPTQVYFKSEADKVIAELEEKHKMEVEQLLIEIAELQKQVRDYAQGLYVIQARAEKEARHQKYKRCLDNAKYWVAVFYQSVDDRHRRSAERHHYKWLELAKHYKEAK